MSEFKELHRMVDAIFAEARTLGWSWDHLAQRAKVGSATVWRLANYETMYPRAQTILLLAKAVGLAVRLERRGAKLSKAG